MRLNDANDALARLIPAGLVSAIERLAGARSQNDVIETLRATARRVAGADGICIVLRDGGNCFYVEEDAIGPLWKGSKFPMETCISGWAMSHGETVVIPDVFLDDRIPHAIYRQTFVKSLVMTPIGRGEPIAALGAYWARNYAAPKEVIETLEALARAAATALENVYLIGALSASLSKMELAREELRHRLNAALDAIDTYGKAALEREAARALGQRVKAIRRAHTVLDNSLASDATVLLGDLVSAELDLYRTDAPDRIKASGPDVRLSGAQAIAVGIVLNELAANAARSGALKSLSGEVNVSWREENRVIALQWQEIDSLTAKRGVEDNINSHMVRMLVTSQLGGTVRGAVAEGAVTVTVEFPAEAAIAFPENRPGD